MSEKIQIIRGDDAEIEILIQEEDLRPYNLSSVTAIIACFKNDDDTNLNLSLLDGDIAVADAIGGKLVITIDDPETLLLKIGEDQSFELQLDEAGVKQTFQFIEKLDIIARIC